MELHWKHNVHTRCHWIAEDELHPAGADTEVGNIGDPTLLLDFFKRVTLEKPLHRMRCVSNRGLDGLQGATAASPAQSQDRGQWYGYLHPQL